LHKGTEERGEPRGGGAKTFSCLFHPSLGDPASLLIGTVYSGVEHAKSAQAHMKIDIKGKEDPGENKVGCSN